MEASRKKRKRSIDSENFLINDTVEVLSSEEGLLGSWRPAKVISRERKHCVVEYDHLISDDLKGPVSERLEISSSINGIDPGLESSSNNRGKIRPTPPEIDFSMRLRYSLCVDAYYKDAWWEGVVFDHQEAFGKWKIFFPDQGDELILSSDELRLTQDWNEATGEWSRRGKWLFMEIIEELQPGCVAETSIKQMWYDLSRSQKFGCLMEWASQKKAVWKKLILEVINDYIGITGGQIFTSINLTQDLVVYSNKSMCSPNFTTNSESNSTKTDAVVPDEKLMLLPSSIQAKDHCSSLNRRKKRFYSPSSDKPIGNLSCIKVTAPWKPIRLDPTKCPSCVTKYLKSAKSEESLATKVRQHLLFLGWEVDFYKGGIHQRFRYTSPNRKPYYSLVEVCKLVNGNASPPLSTDCLYTSSMEVVRVKSSCDAKPINENASTSPSSECPNASALEIAESVVGTYCPEAITEYVQSWDKSLITNTKAIRRNLAEKARQHLKAIGWRFWFTPKGERLEARYESPEKKTYCSLVQACRAVSSSYQLQGSSEEAQSGGKYLLTDSDVKTQQSEESNQLKIINSVNCKLFLKRKRSLFLRDRLPTSISERGSKIKDMEDGFPNGLVNSKKCSLLRKLNAPVLNKKRKVTSAFGEKTRSSDVNPTSQAQRSSKRARQLMTPSSLSHNPRTVLSWLIDNNIVLPRAKVQYRGKENNIMAEGRVTRDGIKCGCCQNVLTLADFESHAKSTYDQPAAHIFLEDGRSLVNCQMQVLHNSMKSFQKDTDGRKRRNVFQSANDYICSVCHYGGDLLLCDGCPASFHANCLNLQSVPDGDWFCPSCCCANCHRSESVDSTMCLNERSALCCDQCERLFHVSCLRGRGVNLGDRPKGKWFCCRTCFEIYAGLQKFQGKTIPLDHDDLTWTLFKPMQYESGDGHDEAHVIMMAENHSKLSLALEVIHECFEPVKESRTGRDLVEDVIFGRRSELKRLDFTGFYTVLLEKKDELVSAATIRIYGGKVAEVPLVGTRFSYRRLGMCRFLMNELEKILSELGVERLVLPAVPGVLNTWTKSFGFSVMTPSERSEFLGYTFLDFQDTVMCHKLLRKPSLTPPSNLSGAVHETVDKGEGSIERDCRSPISEVWRGSQIKCSDSVDEGLLEIPKDNDKNGCKDPYSDVMEISPSEEQCSATEKKHEARERIVERNAFKFKGEIKQYSRRKALSVRANVEVRCI